MSFLVFWIITIVLKSACARKNKNVFANLRQMRPMQACWDYFNCCWDHCKCCWVYCKPASTLVWLLWPPLWLFRLLCHQRNFDLTCKKLLNLVKQPPSSPRAKTAATATAATSIRVPYFINWKLSERLQGLCEADLFVKKNNIIISRASFL